MTTTRHATTCCPRCNAPLDASDGAGHDSAPTPGDWSLCAYCVAPLVYTADLTLRLATIPEVREMATDPDFLRAAASLHTLHSTGREAKH